MASPGKHWERKKKNQGTKKNQALYEWGTTKTGLLITKIRLQWRIQFNEGQTGEMKNLTLWEVFFEMFVIFTSAILSEFLTKNKNYTTIR